MKNDFSHIRYLEIAQSLLLSNYFISAKGNRDVGTAELVEIIRILFENEPSDITNSLRTLYKYHPDTIELNRSYIKYDCKDYDEDFCNCFLPEVESHEWFCVQKRKKDVLSKDKRNYPEYSTWRNNVFQRDEYTCQSCGQVGGELNAHHIKEYKKHKELRLDLNNGTTLCKECHKKLHRLKVDVDNG